MTTIELDETETAADDAPDDRLLSDDRPHVVHLPRRAANLARRVMELEKDCNGRGRLSFDIVMLNGEWLLTVSSAGRLERLG